METYIPFITLHIEEIKTLNQLLKTHLPTVNLTHLDEQFPAAPPLVIIDSRLNKAMQVIETFAMAGIPTIVFGYCATLTESGILQVEDANILPLIIQSFIGA